MENEKDKNKKDQKQKRQNNNIKTIPHYKMVHKKYGVEVGSLFDEVANQCDINDICDLSETSLGNELRMSYKRISRSLKTLLEEGLIEKIERGEKNKFSPNWFKVSKERLYELENEYVEPLMSNMGRSGKI